MNGDKPYFHIEWIMDNIFKLSPEDKAENKKYWDKDASNAAGASGEPGEPGYSPTPEEVKALIEPYIPTIAQRAATMIRRRRIALA